jgi:hypothetical protein
MFYYVIYNSTILNYSLTNKNLNTFIYGTVLYILLHGLINSYNNQFAFYIKSYFWVILAIDIFSIYYMHNFINQSAIDDQENENDIKSLIQSFKKEKTQLTESTEKENGKEKENKKMKANSKENANDNANDKENNQVFEPNAATSEMQAYTELSELDQEQDQEQSDIDEQMSDAGSDIDMDKFEMSL